MIHKTLQHLDKLAKLEGKRKMGYYSHKYNVVSVNPYKNLIKFKYTIDGDLLE